MVSLLDPLPLSPASREHVCFERLSVHTETIRMYESMYICTRRQDHAVAEAVN